MLVAANKRHQWTCCTDTTKHAEHLRQPVRFDRGAQQRQSELKQENHYYVTRMLIFLCLLNLNRPGFTGVRLT
jgi:hypothetical protein